MQRQAFEAYELFLVDDGSLDSSGAPMVRCESKAGNFFPNCGLSARVFASRQPNPSSCFGIIPGHVNPAESSPYATPRKTVYSCHLAAPRDTSCNLAAPRGTSCHLAAPRGTSCTRAANALHGLTPRLSSPCARRFLPHAASICSKALFSMRVKIRCPIRRPGMSQTLLPPCKHTFGCERKGPRAPRATSRYTH